MAPGAGTFGILASIEERELDLPAEQPLIGWRLFRVRRSESGFVLSAPLIHNPGFERFPSPAIDAPATKRNIRSVPVRPLPDRSQACDQQRA